MLFPSPGAFLGMGGFGREEGLEVGPWRPICPICPGGFGYNWGFGTGAEGSGLTGTGGRFELVVLEVLKGVVLDTWEELTGVELLPVLRVPHNGVTWEGVRSFDCTFVTGGLGGPGRVGIWFLLGIVCGLSFGIGGRSLFVLERGELVEPFKWGGGLWVNRGGVIVSTDILSILGGTESPLRVASTAIG